MILNAIAEKLKRQSKDDFKGRHFEAWLIVQAVVASRGDSFELFELAEEVLDQMPPFIDFPVDLDGMFAFRALRDDDLCPAFVHLLDDPVGVEGLIGKDRVEIDAID